MKSYTDLEQGKVLAEILPIKSADMFYTSLNSEYPWIWIDKHLMEVEDIPCWSLSAVLGVLPDYTLQTNTDGTVFVVCESKKPIISNTYNNPVDACVAMIEKLNELNLL